VFVKGSGWWEYWRSLVTLKASVPLCYMTTVLPLSYPRTKLCTETTSILTQGSFLAWFDQRWSCWAEALGRTWTSFSYYNKTISWMCSWSCVNTRCVCVVLRVNWKHYCNQFREGIVGVVRVIVEIIKLHSVNNFYYEAVCFCVWKAFPKKFDFFLLWINMFLMFSNHFDVLISKIILKK